MKAGDKVYVVNILRRGENTPEEYTVATVGRKYFTLSKFNPRYKFSIETGYHVSDTTAHYRVYTSMEAYQDEKRKERLWGKIRGRLQTTYANPFPLETLEGIAKLIGIDDERK